MSCHFDVNICELALFETYELVLLFTIWHYGIR